MRLSPARRLGVPANLPAGKQQHVSQAQCHRQSAGPRLVGELNDPRMEQLLHQRWPGATSDFILPREVDAAAMVQYAIAPEVRRVLDSLLGTQGKEFALQPISRYIGASSVPPARLTTMGGMRSEQTTPTRCLASPTRLRWRDIMQQADSRGEIAVGVLHADERGLVLNPRRAEEIELYEGDQLVVLADVIPDE